MDIQTLDILVVDKTLKERRIDIFFGFLEKIFNRIVPRDPISIEDNSVREAWKKVKVENYDRL